MAWPPFPPFGPRLVRGVLQEFSARDGRTPSRVRGLRSRVRVFCWAMREGALLSRYHFLEETRIQDTTKRVRVNRQIRISPIRVIGPDGAQLGIMEVDAALASAE